MSVILNVENLTISRLGEDIIRDATFTIQKGDYVGIVGPNGGGKTTLLLAILGILKIKSGSIQLFNNRISDFTEWDRLAYVSQNALNFDKNFPLTVREFVSLGRLRRKMFGKRLNSEDWTIIDETIKFMGINSVVNRRIGTLSGGEKQRMFVAKALVRNPDILLLDEPFTGIDAETQERFFKKLSDLNEKKRTTILIVSHDLAAVFCRMSKVICVNREINTADIKDNIDPNEILKEAYGKHFHFVFHRHNCQGVFNNE